jgi:hypothetical protein
MQRGDCALRKDICVQHWVSERKRWDVFELVNKLVVRILNFI